MINNSTLKEYSHAPKMSRVCYLTLATGLVWVAMWDRFFQQRANIGLTRSCMLWCVRKNFVLIHVRLYLSHIPVPARGKDKKKRTATGRTPIRDVIVMLKLRHHVSFQRFHDFLEALFMFFQCKMRYLVASE